MCSKYRLTFSYRATAICYVAVLELAFGDDSPNRSSFMWTKHIIIIMNHGHEMEMARFKLRGAFGAWTVIWPWNDGELTWCGCRGVNTYDLCAETRKLAKKSRAAKSCLAFICHQSRWGKTRTSTGSFCIHLWCYPSFVRSRWSFAICDWQNLFGRATRCFRDFHFWPGCRSCIVWRRFPLAQGRQMMEVWQAWVTVTFIVAVLALDAAESMLPSKFFHQKKRAVNIDWVFHSERRSFAT